MLSRPTLPKSAVSFSPFVSLLVALVELAIARFAIFYLAPGQLLSTKQAIAHLSLFYCSENQPRNQHLHLKQAIANSTIFYLSPGQLPTTKQAIANFNLFFYTKQSSTTKQAIAGLMLLCLPTSPQLALEQAIAAVVGQGYLFRFLALCGLGGQVFLPNF
ncbi:hypothetical protein [Trichocoleus sp. FACHB-262]|uniref:hypothetical protein n=1 Tax=Trichocoleus sp. FACHB-262 TaxID=2692869 RepID=UPI0016860CD6|nr:hypothetical protein [Trichocoleus sp. FACHB-262]MBD2121038.1 hypothetical protein [Trichocoleus sp. FACHB-262]